MGWLFAVALGMQDKNRRAVVAALPPIALGHALAIAVVVGLLWLVQANLHGKAIQIGAAAVLFGFGLYRLVRSQHPKWVGMRVGFRDLTLWSFIMASAHGAGLTLVPILLGFTEGNPVEHGEHIGHMMPAAHADASANGHAAHLSPPLAAAFTGVLSRLGAIGVHTAGHFIVAGLIALLVYEKFGLALLRRAWLNLDLLWVIALMISGVLILLI
jgi:hypothetical protein